MRNYRTRIADRLLERKLISKGAVIIEGAKWCGKTTTAEQKAASILYLADPDRLRQNLLIADTMPSTLLHGDLICRGGWPEAVTMKNKRSALEQAFDYLDAIVRSDISRVDGTLRNPQRARRILRSYARHQGGQVSLSVLKNDLSDNEGESLTTDTISSYINALRKIFVVEDTLSWNPSLRSKAAIRAADTRYFSDPSIAVAALELGVADLMDDLNTMGLLFETLAIRDLRVYAEALNGKVFHYRDSNGLECDAVVHLRGGRYGLVEVKLGGDKSIEEGAKTLLKLNRIIDTTKMSKPSFMMILTAVGAYAFRRKDGIYVVPISCLKD